MNLEPYIAVSGEGGLFKLITSKTNGLILENLNNPGKAKFYSVRKHQFTPLGSIAIYTLEDTSPLEEVFKKMLEIFPEKPPVAVKSEKHQIEEYFESVLPDYDEDRVSVKDMKKVIKWFNVLYEKDLLTSSEEE